MARLMVLHGGALIIADAATDLPLGGIRLFLHGDAVEFGYWLAPGRPRPRARDAGAAARLGRDRLAAASRPGSSCGRRSATLRASAWPRVPASSGSVPSLRSSTRAGGSSRRPSGSCELDAGVALRQSSSWTTRPSIPPATVTTWPLTWPERTSEASTTTWAATSSGCATFRSAIVREIRRTASASTSPRVIGDSVQPGATALTRARGATRVDLVLQRQQQAALERGLRSRVVGVPGLAEAPGGGADEHERAVARARDLAEEAARGQERGGQVLAQRLLPPLERELPDGQVLRRPDARDRSADVDRAERLARGREEAVDVGLDRQVGLRDRGAADLGRDGGRPLLAAVVVDEHLRALGREEARARARRCPPRRR